MNINNKYNFGDKVFLFTDDEQKERIVTAIKIQPSNLLLYGLSCGIEPESYHFDIEITGTKSY